MNLPFDKIDSLTDDQKRALLKLIAEHGTEYHIYPVSLEQKSIWFLYKRDEGKQNLYYNIRFQVKIRGNVSREQITAALQAVADANQILKARFFALGESVFQYITEDAEICILSDTDSMDGVFDLERKGPFQCKIQEVENGFVLDVAIHHIAADGYSIGIFLEDLKKALSGQKITKKGISYFTYSQCQTEPAMKKRREQCIAYWKEKLENAVQIVTFPTDSPRLEYRPAPSHHVTIKLDAAETAAVNSLIQKHRMTSYSFYLAVIVNLLSAFGRTPEIVFASSYLNRNNPHHTDMMGITANMLVQRVRADRNTHFCEWVKQIQKDMFDGIGYMDIGIDEMLNCFDNRKIEGGHPCYQVLYSIRKQKHYVSSDTAVGQDAVTVELVMDTEENADNFDYDLSFAVYEYEEHSEISITFHSLLYSDAKIEKLAVALKESISMVIADSTQCERAYIPAWFQEYANSFAETADEAMYAEIAKAIGCQDLYIRTENYDGRRYCAVCCTSPAIPERYGALEEKYGIFIPIWIADMPYDITGKVNTALLRILYAQQIQSVIKAYDALLSFDAVSNAEIYQIPSDANRGHFPMISLQREPVVSDVEREWQFCGDKKTYFKLKQKYHTICYLGTNAELETVQIDDKPLFVEAQDKNFVFPENVLQKMQGGLVRVFYPDGTDIQATGTICQIINDGTDSASRMLAELKSMEHNAAVLYADGVRTGLVRNGFPDPHLRYEIHYSLKEKATPLDRRALYDQVQCAFITFVQDTEAEEPAEDSHFLSETEQKIMKIWCKNLEMDTINLYDKLFEIGGDSYRCMNIFNELKQEGYDFLQITDLFSYSSIFTLANYIDSRRNVQKADTSGAMELMF